MIEEGGYLAEDVEEGMDIGKERNRFWFGKIENNPAEDTREIDTEEDGSCAETEEGVLEDQTCAVATVGKEKAQQCSQSEDSTLFACLECGAEFKLYRNYLRHMDFGKHRRVPEKQTIRDYSFRTFKNILEERIESRIGEVSTALEALHTEDEVEKESKIAKGWAMKSKKQNERIPESSKEYVKEAFLKAKKEKRRRIDFKQLALTMREERREDGTLRFLRNELLTYQQIGGIFAKLVKSTEGKRTAHDIEKAIEKGVDELDKEEGSIEVEFQKDPHNMLQEDIYAKNVEYQYDYIFGDQEEPRNEPQDLPHEMGPFHEKH